jgi:AcrR family transcriptional regulator
MLEAAAYEFAEQGVEAATIEAIAKRAGTSVGSIYQFFPNKLALYEALGDAYIAECRALFDALVSEDTVAPGTSWRQIMRATIDAFGELHRSSVTFRAIASNIVYSRRFLDAGQALNRELADRVEAVFKQLAKDVPPARRRLMATVVIETLSALLLVAFDKPGPQNKALMNEAKDLVERYLAPYFEG